MPAKKHWVLVCLDGIKWVDSADVYINYGHGLSVRFSNPAQLNHLDNTLLMVNGMTQTIIKLDSVVSIEIRTRQFDGHV